LAHESRYDGNHYRKQGTLLHEKERFMHLTFIRPSIYGTRAHDAMEPLAFAILAGLTRSTITLSLYDERVEEVPAHLDTDVVALTVETYTARRAYQLATRFRQQGIKVIMGGYHPTFLPDEALQFADAVVLGDAEGVWGQILHDLPRGKLQSRYQSAALPSLQTVRYDRRLFQGKRYQPILPIQYGRGCKFACDFCSIHAFYGTSLRQRPVEAVVAEIRASGRMYVLIIDDNIFVDVPKAKELFEALIPLKVKWGCQVSVDVARDEELVRLMGRSGCIAALVGFESLDGDNLRQMKKGWNLKYGDYTTAIRRFQAHGIMVYGSFIFGYDHDTPDTFQATLDFALQHHLFLANFSALTPTPGAELYDRMAAEGRLLFDKWWLHPDYRYGMATFTPARMSPQTLTEGCLQTRHVFYTLSAVARRMRHAAIPSLAHVGLFLGANLLTRRELKGKLGQRLGTAEWVCY